ncbi:MAG: hypothetical protein ACJ8FY_09750 [Gemmataceae bacterium]
MATDIGTLATKLTVNAQTMDSGLAQAQAKLSKFAGTASKLGGGAFQNFAAGNSAGIFTSPLQSGLAALPGGGIAAGAIGILQQFDQVMKETKSDIAETSKQADALGISYASMLSLQNAAGDSAGAMRHGLGHLGKELFAATHGSQEAADKFSKLGLSASQLASVPLDKALGMVADRVKQAGPGMGGLGVSMTLLGKAGAELNPMLGKGAEGLEKYRQRTEKSGRALSDMEARTVRLSLINKKELDEELQGYKDRIAAEDSLTKVAIQRLTMAPSVLGRAWKSALLFPGDVEAERQRIKEEQVEKHKREQGNPGELFRAERLASADELEKKLQRTVDTFGMTQSAITRFIEVEAGSTDEDLKKVDALQAVADRMIKFSDTANGGITSLQKYQMAWGKLFEEWGRDGAEIEGLARSMGELNRQLAGNLKGDAAKAIAESFNPLEEARAKLENLQKMLGDKLINKDVFNAGAAKIGNGLVAAAGLGDARLPPALIEGSAAAQSAITQHQFGGRADPQTRVADAVERLEQIAKETKVANERTANAVEKLPQLNKVGRN